MKSNRLPIAAEEWSPSTEAVSGRLEHARSQIEERFLDGGAVLVTVMDTLTKLVQLLDGLGNSLKDDEAREAADRLTMTARMLDAVPLQQSDRRRRLMAIKDLGQCFATHIDSMHEALRYLRTFAMTAKIAGAQIPDFADFAAEIMERILYATQQVKVLGQQVALMENQIGQAVKEGAEVLDDRLTGLPELVTRLRKNSELIDAERTQLSKIAAQVADLARKAQSKVGQTLSAMQIGDITRQRIEHCQSAFSITQAFIESEAPATLGADERRDLLVMATQLVHALLSQTTVEFDRDSGRVVDIIRSMYGDMSALMKLHEGLIGGGPSAAGGNTIALLHKDLTAAHGIVEKISTAAAQADELGQKTAGLVSELTECVETIQLVRRDIQYMALNTMLRCSRLGDEGRPLNVVSGELRSFSSVLDEHAEQILVNLRKLEAEAQGLSSYNANEDGANHGNLPDVVNGVIALLGEAGKTMDDNIDALRQSGQDMTAKVMSAVNRLDFKAGIGETLAACRDEAGEYADYEIDTAPLQDALSIVGERIARTYTMIAERNIHAEIFGEAVHEEVAGAGPSDDDLLEDALF